MYWIIKDYGFFYHVTIATVVPLIVHTDGVVLV